MTLNAIRIKIERLARGENIRVLDLFSGCGGFSLGFKAADFDIVGAIEKDPVAARTHAENFIKKVSSEAPDSDHSASIETHSIHEKARDIKKITPGKLIRELGLGPRSKAIDIIIAGPPCQSYARVGRAKLRALAQNPNAFLHDRRGKLYERLLYFVRVLKPLAVVFENVPDVLNQAGENVVEHVCKALDDYGYVSRYTTLNATRYGVPQMRERVFLIAYAKELGADPGFPQPTHQIELPRGYRNTRDVALKPLRSDSADESGSALRSAHYVHPPLPSEDLPDAVTAKQALKDLPVITNAMKAAIRRGPRRFDQPFSYPKVKSLSEYARQARSWKRFESTGSICDHVIRRLPRDYPIFCRMQPGDQYPEAHEIAGKILWPQKMKNLGLTDLDSDPASRQYDRYVAERKKVVPLYDSTKFVDKWRKMDGDEPARTLTAHLGRDCYTHIHYDSDQARTISVREAARLQSFPDGFKFEGSMNAAYKQIGNAVPPLLARALAIQIKWQLGMAVGLQATSHDEGTLVSQTAYKQVLDDSSGDGQAGK